MDLDVVQRIADEEEVRGVMNCLPLARRGRLGGPRRGWLRMMRPGTTAGLPSAPLSCLALRNLRVSPRRDRERKPEQRNAPNAESEWKKPKLKN